MSLSLTNFQGNEATGTLGVNNAKFGYKRVDDKTWHVLDDNGDTTIELKRK